MEISQMKMTVTLEKKEVEEILKEWVARKIGRPDKDITKIELNVGTREEGNQRDSYTVAFFKNVTVDIKGL